MVFSVKIVLDYYPNLYTDQIVRKRLNNLIIDEIISILWIRKNSWAIDARRLDQLSDRVRCIDISGGRKWVVEIFPYT